MFNFMPVMELQNWFEATFPDKMMLEGETPYDKFFDGLDKLELAEVLRTVQVCSVKDREAYNMALSAIDDPRKKQDYAIWWKEQRSTSLNDIAHRAWDFADKLEALLRKEGHT